MKNKTVIYKQCIVALCVAINIIGSFVAMGLRLPIYLDSIGTIFVSSVFGTGYGVITGILSNLINGISFDIYSLYYIPVQIVTAVMAGYVAKKGWNRNWRSFAGAMVISVPASFAGALITAVVFGGITSSGSSYFVAIMHNMGMNLTLSCFIVQVFTDYFDKLVTVLIVQTILKRGVAGKGYGTLQQDHKQKSKGDRSFESKTMRMGKM